MNNFDIEITGLTKRFGTLTAVDNLNLQIPAGAIFGFIGPNGSGKSTTVKMLTGLLLPTFGSIEIAGQSLINAPQQVKQIIGVLPEDFALFQSLTIWEHLLMIGPVYQLDSAVTRQRAEQLLKYLDLWQSRDTYVERASYGMKKKCALAMALLHNPRILFLDEPFEGIDPGSARNIKELLQMLAGKGITIFLTSHILDVLERLIQRYAIILHGQLVFSGTIAELTQSGKRLEDIYFQYAGRDNVEELEWLG